MNVKTSAALAALTRSKQNYLAVFAISFFCYMFFNHALPITDPVESNYALTAKEMVLTADWLSPRIYGNVWFDKPVFFYWLTAIAFKLFGFSAGAARLAPALFAAAGLVLLYWFSAKIAKQSVAGLAVVIMGTSLEYIILAKLVITDMVFFVFNCAALSFFYLGYIKMDGTKRWYLLAYVCIALAVLTKGPVGALLPGLVMVLFTAAQGNWTELREMFMPAGIFIFAVVALPWYIAMYALHGAAFIDTFFGVHNYLRATVSEHPEYNVSYYYMAVFLLSMLPWSALAVKALLHGCKTVRSNSSPLLLFILTWIVVYFGFYSLMATKYLTYTFPIHFPAALLTAISLEKMLIQGKVTAIAYWVGIPSALLLLGYMVAAYHYLQGLGLIVTAAGLLLVLLFGCWKSRGRSAACVFRILCLCQLASYIMLSLFLFPAMADSRSGKGLAENMAGFGMERIGLYQFYSTSAVFYSGTIAVRLEPSMSPLPPSGALDWSSKYTMPTQGLDDFMTHSPQSLIVVPDKQKGLFLLETANFNPQLVKSSTGLNYYISH